MDEQKLTAFSLKYQGKTYAEIAADPRVQLTEGTLAVYLSPEGVWGPEYRLFCKERNKLVEQATLSIFKGVAQEAAEGMQEALKDARKEVAHLKADLLILNGTLSSLEGQDKLKCLEQIDFLKGRILKAQERVMNYSERILDRAGMPIIKKVEVEDGDKELDPDNINNILEAAGIDPESIRYKSKAPERTEGTV